MKIVRNEMFLFSGHADGRLNFQECYRRSRTRRRQFGPECTAAEKFSSISINSSLYWLDVSASSVCSGYASSLQQMMLSSTVNFDLSQIQYPRLLKKCDTLIA